MEQSSELQALVRAFSDAAAKGDVDAIDRLFWRRDDVLVIGTDPNEWWTGHRSIMDTFKAQIREMGGSLPMVPGDPQAFSEGTIGWIAVGVSNEQVVGKELPV